MYVAQAVRSAPPQYGVPVPSRQSGMGLRGRPVPYLTGLIYGYKLLPSTEIFYTPEHNLK